AGLWTDSRYFLQAEMQIKGSEFVLHKMHQQFGMAYIDYLMEVLPAESTVCINGFMFAKAAVDGMVKSFAHKRIQVVHRLDLISLIWSDRPPLSNAPILFHEDRFSGNPISRKLSVIRQEMDRNEVRYHLITALDDLAWTFNIRGKDVSYNPVAIAYAVVGLSDAHIFVDQSKLSIAVKKEFAQNNITIHPYASIIGFINQLEATDNILVDHQLCSQSLYESINAHIVHGNSIPKTLKAIKNETEISHIRSVMKKDGAALANTFYWLEQTLGKGDHISEVDVANKLAEHRSEQKYYQGESFGAIVGYKGNGAIIHYHPEPETCKTIHPEGILLVDSGGQYCDGTTDITRTFALDMPTDEQKKSYTLILKGMIALTLAKFPEGTTGIQLDILARQFLWAEGLNYGHGTGHGVGFYLNVHEPPQGFAPTIASERGKSVFLAGMLTSNEPGYYKEGEYGMRIENLILTIPAKAEGFLEFETVTLYPFDHTLIDKSRLTGTEIKWINDYHQSVYEHIVPSLEGEVKEWFREKCKEV
ncbi:MAG: aminopeptidase family protein P, partial [Saprospiraceae bacterium]